MVDLKEFMGAGRGGGRAEEILDELNARLPILMLVIQAVIDSKFSTGLIYSKCTQMR